MRPRLARLLPVIGGSVPTVETTVTIANTGGTELTDYPVRVDVTSISGMNAGLTNVDFQQSGTALSYWRESVVSGTSAVFWVKIPTIPAEGLTITMRHGGGVSDLSDGDNVFSLFDDFDKALTVQANNAAAVSVDTAGFLAENIVFDSVTNKYWWIFQDGNPTPDTIRMASCDDISSPTWTVEADPVLSGADNYNSPYLVKFGETWYIYYGNDGGMDIYVQSSSTVNSGYGSATKVLDNGGVGTWDAYRVLEPFVFQIGATYYMLYMGGDVSGGGELEKVGLATASAPAGPWTKHASNPVMSGDTGWWDAGNDKAADPFVIEKDGVYYVGVTACPSGKAGWYIGFFTTTDFVTYTPIADNPVLGHGISIDLTSVIRGAVSLFGGVYYFPYTAGGAAGTKLALTTAQFNIVGLNRRIWHEGGGYEVTGGTVVNNAAADYFESKSTFGPGYAYRARAIYAANTTRGDTIFFDKTDASSDIVGFVANLTSGQTKGWNNVSGDALTANLGAPGAYHVYEVARNAGTNTLFSIDDAAPTALTTQIPAGALPLTSIRTVTTDWILVRKYVNPEPTASIA